MSQASSVTSGLVRVTVASGSRRVDLVLPGSVPVAELVPELARSVGLLDAGTVHGGYRLLVPDGRALAGDAGLVMQGVEDGSLLTVTAGIDDEPPRVYDDVVEAMVDVVEHELQPWEAATGRRTALCAAGILLALGALSLLLQGPGTLPGVAAALVALLLTVGGIVLARTQDEPEAGVAVALLAPLHAAAAGILLTAEGVGATWPLPPELFDLPLVAAGTGVLVVGIVAVVGLAEGRALLIPGIVVGAVFVVLGLVHHVADYDPTSVLPAVMTFLVLLGSIFPWLALGTTGTKVEQIYSHADVTADPDEIDPERVGADARLAHEILLAVSATGGIVLVLLAPFAVSRGIGGTVLATLCCVAVMMRTRQYRTGSEVLTGLVSGIAGLVSVALTMLLVHDQWRSGAAIALAVLGAVLLVSTLVPASPSVRRGRRADVAESLTLLALLPLTVVATGLFDRVAG